MQRKIAFDIFLLLAREYPDAHEPQISPARGEPFEVLILTILSAQTTDRAVLKVKKSLFSKYPTPESLAAADPEDVEEIIHSLGYFHAKARHIIAAANKVVREFRGIVPGTMKELLTIPGVGRKTANIVLFHGHGKTEGIAVDTHVRRLAERIGFSRTNNVMIIEQDLMHFYPKEQWGNLTDLLIAHGRKICTAKIPYCDRCVISQYCRYYRNLGKTKIGAKS